MPTLRPILLLEDDTLDAMIVKRTLGKLDVHNPVIHRTNGEEGLQHLRRCPYEQPCLILLDLNMPRMNGLEFLRQIRKDTTLQALNVVILTTSTHQDDITTGLQLGVRKYIVKCIDSQEFARDLSVVREYCTAPNRSEAVECENVAR